MEKSKRKVLFLITKSNWGGAQRYVYDLATALPRAEFEVVVATGGQGELISRLASGGVRVVALPSLQRDLSLTKEIRSLFELWRLIRYERPDMLHINSSKAGALGALIGRLAGVPKIIFTAHGWAFNEDRPVWQQSIFKAVHWLTVLLSHHTIAVSGEVKRQMNWPLATKKMVVIHNGRTIEHFKDRQEARADLCRLEPRLLPYQQDLWSITIAELHPVKRNSAVIEAVKEIVATAPNHRHLIIGDGQEKAVLETEIKALGLEQNVFLLGSVPEAAAYLKAADIFILASRSEAMAYVIIEAAAAGIPIVATKVGGIPEIIEDQKNGLLTPPLDNRALVSAILSLVDDLSLRLRLGTAAKERALEFSFEKTLRSTLAIYRD